MIFDRSVVGLAAEAVARASGVVFTRRTSWPAALQWKFRESWLVNYWRDARIWLAVRLLGHGRRSATEAATQPMIAIASVPQSW